MISKELLEHEMRTNIIDEETTQAIISGTFSKIADSISNTLGPYGSHTIIKDPYNIEHPITKDGYTMLNKIKFDGTMQSTIASIILKISRALVQEVGDASTSSVIVAEAMYKELINFFNSNVLPRKDALDTLILIQEIVEKYIIKYSKKLENKEQLSKVATISNNNDKNIGDLVASVYEELGFQGFINLELSPSEKTFHKITNGIEIERSYINFIFTNQKDKTTCIYEEARVLMCNDVLTEDDTEFLGQILEVVFASGIPLVIIAKGYSNEITNILTCNKAKYKDKFPVLPIDYTLSNLKQHSSFEDLAIYLGATIYDKYNGVVIEPNEAAKFFAHELGKCNKVISNGKRTSFIEGNFNKELRQDRLDLIDEEIEKLNEKKNFIDIDMEKYELEKRKNVLKGKIANLYVGGDSDIEKKTKRDLVEDSIYSCKSAIEYGYVLGGNLIIPYILKNHHDEIKEEILNNDQIFMGFYKTEREEFIEKLLILIEEAFLVSFTKVLFNKFRDKNQAKKIATDCISMEELTIFNLKKNRYETIVDSDVINSARTDIEIMKSVFSIVGLLASSNQMLASDCIY